MTAWIDAMRSAKRERKCKKNLEVFKPGVPRQLVLAEMGLPSGYENRNGVRSEVYKFKQGYSQPVRISRAVLHGTADILAFGLWEAVGTPEELVFSGTDTMVLVVCACVPTTRSVLENKDSEVRLRSIQSRVFETPDENQTMRTAIATLQDLRFVVDKANSSLGTVTPPGFRVTC